ncbi:gamma-glutamylcyclotransferase family protein [Streptomyces millisiae]|uniref:Putative gamma-glutamylcyclotransferase n=1 Tax=Streptomyces millisiae TaxID=3075542 RepID=A0ABU2LWD8_9ACTN|nr:gamma-glutamylcyclotransferase family protein [Streptomyces sp. DSM 44918]MDT0321904.1 gamma-glutamylcyclotransferase family protein [Streptomyces sp. DSM 44918]
MGRLGSPPAGLFVYGTLRCDRVLDGLLRRIPRGVPDSAPGWRVASLAARVYPGLVPGPGAAVGLVLSDLTLPEWRILDDFEDQCYELRPLTLASGRDAVAYVWTVDSEVLASDWDLTSFERDHVAAYVARFQ